MAVIEHEFLVESRDIGKNNKLTNRAVIGFFEEIAGFHSNIAGFGLNDIERTGLTWMLLNWKVRIFKRPSYTQKVFAKTWGRDAKKCFTFRDFELYDENNNLLAIATTKWVLIDAKTMGLAKLSNELIASYELEQTKVFGDEPEPNKIVSPEEFSSTSTYVARRRDIDVNHHVHNVTYLDIAYDALPYDVYENANFDNFEIMYKKEIKLGESIKCFYEKQGNSHYVVMKSMDEQAIHCIVRLDEAKE